MLLPLFQALEDSANTRSDPQFQLAVPRGGSVSSGTKMTALLLAVMFTLTVRRFVTFAPDGRFSSVWNRTVAVTSIALWSTVGWGGRWIGFSG